MSTPDIDTQVNEAIAGRTEVEGKMVFAEDLDPMLKYAANAELRRRDTQSSYTKTQQENLALVSENSQLADSWATEVSKTLTVEQQQELEELAHTDKEAWREKINKYETANASRVKEKHTEIKKKAGKETEVQQRERHLEEYNKANPDYVLTDDVIDNDLPPRITKKLEEGKITFDEFIQEAHKYLSAGKVISKGDPAPNEPDLSKSGGSSKPTDQAVDGDIKESYKKEIF